jgi:hypothetical protein
MKNLLEPPTHKKKPKTAFQFEKKSVYSTAMDIKRKAGRPKGSVKMTIQRYADNPPAVLPKTDYQKIKELKELMIKSGGKDVAQKVIEIALNDQHPGQMAALKMCLDRTLPVSLFDKDKAQRGAVTINITGIGATTETIEAEDIEPKYG